MVVLLSASLALEERPQEEWSIRSQEFLVRRGWVSWGRTLLRTFATHCLWNTTVGSVGQGCEKSISSGRCIVRTEGGMSLCTPRAEMTLWVEITWEATLTLSGH